MGTRSCEEITGAASWSLILLARPKLPLLRPPPQSPLGLKEATGVWKALMGSDLLNGPGLGLWEPNFSSDLLPSLERSPTPTQVSMHYYKVYRDISAGLQTNWDCLEEQKHQKKQVAQMIGTQPSRSPKRGSESSL